MKLLRQSALLLTAFAAGPALASEARLCPLVRTLEAFMVETTAYSASPICPAIGIGLPSDAAAVRSQAGAYLPDSGRIELAPDLDLATPLGQSFLLHELVHAAQYRHGIDQRVACIGQLEAEAYAVQAAFLRAAGLPRDAATMQIVAAQIGHCGGAEPYG